MVHSYTCVVLVNVSVPELFVMYLSLNFTSQGVDEAKHLTPIQLPLFMQSTPRGSGRAMCALLVLR